jgi:hypothetical protein
MLSLSKLSSIVLLVSFVFAGLNARASTILELSFADVVETAELIFEGRVTAVQASEDSDGIHTWVSFEVLDVIKGEYSPATLELRYLGGRVGRRQLQITEMVLPLPGERGFYFVESLQEKMVHPLVGWSQGHYIIERTRNGAAYVSSSMRRPILSIDGAPQKSDPDTFSKGVAKGVTVMEMNLPDNAMTVDGFKAAVRNSMGQSQSQSRD